MRHPGHFEMSVIATKTSCGSVMCIAGHTLDLMGYKRRLRPKEKRTQALDFDFFSPMGRKVRNPLAAAARELGLNYRIGNGNKAYALFHNWELNTPAEAATRIQELIDGEGFYRQQRLEILPRR